MRPLNLVSRIEFQYFLLIAYFVRDEKVKNDATKNWEKFIPITI